MPWLVGLLTDIVVGYAIGYAVNYFFGKKADPRVFSPKFEDNQAQVRSAVESHKIVYGKSLTSGPLTFAATNGPGNLYMHIVVPLTGHEVKAIDTVYFDDISSSGTEYNKLETWTFQAYKIKSAGTLQWIVVEINGQYFFASAASAARVGGSIQFANSLLACIQSAPGYAAQNYTATLLNAVTVQVQAKAFGDVITASNYYGPGETIACGGGIGWTTRPEDGDFAIVRTVKGHIFDLYKHLGAPAQTADTNLVTENVGWTANHRLRGRAYIYTKLGFYADRWPTGIPVLKAEVRGRLAYDPRSTLTDWTDNAAICIRDYLTQPFGLGAGAGEINDATFIAAANICDEYVLASSPKTITSSSVANPTVITATAHKLRTGDEVAIAGHAGSTPILNGNHTVTVLTANTVTIPVNVTVGGTGGTLQLRQKRYTCNGTIALGERPIDIIQKMLTALDGTLVYSEGKYSLFAGAYTAPVGDLNESHLRSGLRVVAKPPRKQLFNGVRGTILDPKRFWQETDFPAYKNSTYATEDGETIIRDITLPFTSDAFAAQRMAKQILERARQSIMVVFPAKLHAFKYSVNDVVRLSISYLGWTNKEFRVVSWSLTDFGVDVTLQEEASASYNWNNGDETIIDPAPNSNLPSVFDVLPPTGVTAVEQLYQGLSTAGFRSRLKISWIVSSDTNVTGYVIFWKSYADTYEAADNWHDGQSQIITGNSFNLEDVPTGTFFISMKATNGLGFYSLETVAIQVQVLGKIAPPADVTGFSVGQNGDVVVFTWSIVSDVDLKGYEVRYGPRTTMVWNGGVVVTQAERGTEVTTALIPPGDWKFCIKAQDTSGIYSVNAACRELVVTQSRSIIKTLFEDTDFLGTKSNFVHHWTGALVPDSQDLASVNSWDTFDQFVPNAYATCLYTPLNDIDIGFVDDVRVWADVSAAMGPDETTGSPQPFTELDYHSGAGFDGFEPWTIGLINARHVRMRLGVTPALGKCYVSRFRVNADVAEQTESGSNVAIGASGTLITFANQFHSAPSIQITVQGTALIATYTVATGISFTAHVYNTSGAEVGGTINWVAIGV